MEKHLTKLLVSLSEAAEAIGVCRRTVDNLIAAKQLPARKIGRRTLIPYSALLAFVRRDHPTREAKDQSGVVPQ
jgi:excisionase family DNA binding protein